MGSPGRHEHSCRAWGKGGTLTSEGSIRYRLLSWDTGEDPPANNNGEGPDSVDGRVQTSVGAEEKDRNKFSDSLKKHRLHAKRARPRLLSSGRKSNAPIRYASCGPEPGRRKGKGARLTGNRPLSLRGGNLKSFRARRRKLIYQATSGPFRC